MSEFPHYDEHGRVYCQLCGKTFQVISATHLKKHETTIKKYRKQFPDAPIFSEEFKAKSTYTKINIFKDKLKIDEKLVFDEITVDEPKVEVIDLVEAEKKYSKLDPISSTKLRILDWLKLYLPNVKQDYLISEYLLDGRLKYEFITDYCDPYLKVDVEFPDTFWHNRGSIDLNRNNKLSEDGWTVIEIPSKAPSAEDIEKYLSNM